MITSGFEVAMDEQHKHNAAESLPDDLIYEILSLLPVKTLIRFRSVCKSWYSLIGNSAFIKLHLANHSRRDDNSYILVMSGSIFCSLYSGKTCDQMRSTTMELPYMPIDCRVGVFCSIVGSCNGLMCIQNSHNFGQYLYFWNPCIRRFKPIPPCLSSQYWRIGLYDPADNTRYVCGMGFHGPTNDYVVVVLTYYDYITKDDNDDCRDKVEVYSLNADSWRSTVVSRKQALPVIDEYSSMPASVNGYIYWLGAGERMLSFRIAGDDDLFEHITLPKSEYTRGQYRLSLVASHIEVVKESLYLLMAPLIRFGEERDQCDIWVMREHGVFESWTKLFSVIIKNGISEQCGVSLEVLGTHGLTVNGELLLGMKEVDEETLNEILFVYDHEKSNYGDLRYRAFLHGVKSSMESLVLLD